MCYMERSTVVGLLFSVTRHTVIANCALPTLTALVDLVLVPGVFHQRLVVGELRVALRAERQPGHGNLDEDGVGGGPVGGDSLIGDVIQPVGAGVGVGAGHEPHWSHAEA